MRTKQLILIQMTLIFTFVSLCFISQQAQAQPSACLTCHQDTQDLTSEHFYIHRPVQEELCHVCHDKNTTEFLPTQQNDDNPQIIIESQENKIEWLAESFVNNTHQVALLPADVAGRQLTIKIWYKNRQKTTAEIQCPDIESLQQKKEETSPAITQLHLHDYNVQLLTRATLNWITTTACQCQLTYRYTDHEYTIAEDDFYTLNHTIEIRNFTANATSVMVTCNDSAQKQTSTAFIPLHTLPLIVADEQSEASELENFSTQFEQNNHFIAVTILTSQPATLSIGRLEQNNKPEPLENVPSPQKDNPTDELDHISLTSNEQLNTKICFQCHTSTVEGASHPINVVAPFGMIIPPEYPLLENGRLTCMTCHQHHSSNNEARLLKESKKELCTGCHTNY